MRRALCWLASLFLCLRLGAEEIVVASYNVENYLRMDRRVDNKNLKDAPKPESEIEGQTPDRVLSNVLDSVEVPR